MKHLEGALPYLSFLQPNGQTSVRIKPSLLWSLVSGRINLLNVPPYFLGGGEAITSLIHLALAVSAVSDHARSRLTSATALLKTWLTSMFYGHFSLTFCSP